MTDPLNETIVLGNASSASVSATNSGGEEEEETKDERYEVSASVLSCHRAKSEAATIALERRDMQDARVRRARMSAWVGLWGDGCREWNVEMAVVRAGDWSL